MIWQEVLEPDQIWLAKNTLTPTCKAWTIDFGIEFLFT